ncbi:RGG repeats nuclear RNA binding protein A [Sesamum alatum]|uniref:RGG repeats nuclear RNA binding protein A n=1 Tax=Sesamum alatum TaxID=300844 RepID=A0AAE1YRD6_9LAMI|nr:RGG repeats nuclear RNA binding protein A [Sesamum alatum]
MKVSVEVCGGGRATGRGRGGRGFSRDFVDRLLLKDVHMVDHVEVGAPVVVVLVASVMVKLPDGDHPRRVFDRRSGTGRGTEFKREGAGRGNWGTQTDEIVQEAEEPDSKGAKNVDSEKRSGQDDVCDANKDASAKEQEEKEPEEKEMTLEEYQKVLEEKRKALFALKSQERKVNLDKELESMQLLSNKKNDDEVFIKLVSANLGSDKDKRKEGTEKAKKSVSINEFLKPAEGEKYYRAGGRGTGRAVVEVDMEETTMTCRPQLLKM